MPALWCAALVELGIAEGDDGDAAQATRAALEANVGVAWAIAFSRVFDEVRRARARALQLPIFARTLRA